LTPRTDICKVFSDSLNAIMKVSYDDDIELVQNYITHRNSTKSTKLLQSTKNELIFEFNQFLQSNGNLCDYTGKAQYSFDSLNV
jgi:hypothetical protein